MTRIPAKTLFSIAALLCLAALGAVLFLFAYIKDASTAVSALQGRIAFGQTRNQRVALMKSSLADSAALRGELDSYFVSKDGIVDFLNGIEALAARAGVVLKVSSVTEETAGDGDAALPVLQVSLDAEGTWKQVATFGEMLRLLPYKTDFAAVSLASEGGPALGADGKPAKGGASKWKGDYDFTVLKKN